MILEVYLKEPCAQVYKAVCTRTFNPAWFITAKRQKHFKCPAIREGLNKSIAVYPAQWTTTAPASMLKYIHTY